MDVDQFEQRVEEDGLYVLQRTGAVQLLPLDRYAMTVASGVWTKVPDGRLSLPATEGTPIEWDTEDI